MNVAIVVQARIHSTRLPRKVLLDIGGKTALERVVDRCKLVASADEVVVACPHADELPIYERTGIPPFPGPEHDLVTRLLQAARAMGADKFVRVTADCPLIDPYLIQKAINYACVVKEPVVCNWVKRWYPNGQDLEVYDVSWLEKWAQQELSLTDREWFPLRVVNDGQAMVRSLVAPFDASGYRMTMDYALDLTVIRCVYDAMKDEVWGWEKIVDWLRANPQVAKLNKKYERETGNKIG